MERSFEVVCGVGCGLAVSIPFVALSLGIAIRIFYLVVQGAQ